MAAASHPVPPAAVYVWRGFRSPSLTQDAFALFLGSVFVPACALLQPRVGLRAYLPTMVPQAGKPPGVPDQTALMFWDTMTAHDEAQQAIAARIYKNLHGDAYDMTRSGRIEQPLPLDPASTTLAAEQPYFLFDASADWMLGDAIHLVGARPPAVSPEGFRAQIGAWAKRLRERPPAGVDAALVCCGDGYVVAWAHAPPGGSVPTALDDLAGVALVVLKQQPRAIDLPAGLWEGWPGLDLTKDVCINIQLQRPDGVRVLPPGSDAEEAPSETLAVPVRRSLPRPMHHVESPHLALWKSAVSRVLARAEGQEHTTSASVDSEHVLMRATDAYCRAMARNEPIPEPSADRRDDPEVETYLSSLFHRRAHAKIAGDAALERQIERQTQRFKFGNPLWQDMFVRYFDYYWQYPYHTGQAPRYRSWQDPSGGRGDASYGVVPWRLPADATVAIVGDIGTGTDLAAAVLVSALAFRPDAILHAGDVYFSGTAFETSRRFVGLLRAVQRSVGRRVPVFSVPGNHEYFTGAVSYLRALDSGHLIVEPSQRQAASYFSVRTEDDGWQFLGLDTGYNGHYMNVAGQAQKAVLDRLHVGPVAGASTDPGWPPTNPYLTPVDPTKPANPVTLRDDEAAWHRDKLEQFAGRSILLSHHQLYSANQTCGPAQRSVAGANGATSPDVTDFAREWINAGLWRQLGAAFGDRVAAWIWGHEHNLGIFQSAYRPADWPQGVPDATQTFKTLPKGRCAGHGAIPVQQAEGPYEEKHPVPLEGPMLEITDGWYDRGFQIVRLAGRGKPARVSYFQVRGADPTPLRVHDETFE